MYKATNTEYYQIGPGITGTFIEDCSKLAIINFQIKDNYSHTCPYLKSLSLFVLHLLFTLSKPTKQEFIVISN